MEDEGTIENSSSTQTGGTEGTGAPVQETSTENFSALSEYQVPDSDEGELGEEHVTQEPPVKQVTTPATLAPVAVTPAAPAAPIIPAAPPASTGQAPPAAPVPASPTVTQPAPQAAQAPAYDPSQYQAYREQTIKGLEANYVFTEEQKAALLVEPETVLPRLAAETTLNAFEAAYAAVAQMLPQMIRNVQRQQTQTETVRRAFFETWPQLNNPQYGGKIREIAEAYMKVNPKATEKDQIQGIGAMAMYMLGLRQEAPATTTVRQVPATGVPVVVPPVAPQPFSPAAPGRSGSGLPTGTKTVFEELIDFEMRDED